MHVFWNVKGNCSTRRKPMQARGEDANTTQEIQSQNRTPLQMYLMLSIHTVLAAKLFYYEHPWTCSFRDEFCGLMNGENKNIFMRNDLPCFPLLRRILRFISCSMLLFVVHLFFSKWVCFPFCRHLVRMWTVDSCNLEELSPKCLSPWIMLRSMVHVDSSLLNDMCSLLNDMSPWWWHWVRQE